MKFSVIVPTYNRISSLKRTLASVLRQTYPAAEIIVVNDGSTDETDSWLSQLASEQKIKYVKQENNGPAAARNTGLAKASAEYIAFTDDDCVVPDDWLKRLSEAFEQSVADIIGGVAKNCIERNIYSELSQEMTNHFINTMARNNSRSSFLTSNNIAYRSAAIAGAGGFDERFRRAGGEERAVNWKIIVQGGKSSLRPDIVIEHYHRLGLRSFLRQHRDYGRGAYILNRVIAPELNVDSPMLPLSVYGSLIVSFFRKSPLRGMAKLFLFC